MSKTDYPCVCCGHCTLSDSAGSYQICPVCFWEDDTTQLAFPNLAGGANRVSLIEAQQRLLTHGASDLAMKVHVRHPTGDEPKDLNWVPYDSSRHRGLDWFSKTDRSTWDDLKGDHPKPYYWRT
jgi:hypothetical protein